jgi:hypothetical protein
VSEEHGGKLDVEGAQKADRRARAAEAISNQTSPVAAEHRNVEDAEREADPKTKVEAKAD